MRKVVIPVAALVAVALAFSVAVAEEKAAQPAAKSADGAQVGQAAPAFSLKDQDGKTVSLADFKGKTVVLEWFNQQCPYVVSRYKEPAKRTMANTAEKYKDKDVVWLAINTTGKSNEENKETKQLWKIDYPILNDTTTSVAQAYGAKSTPHMFVIDTKGNLAYRGGLDNAPMGKVEGEGTEPVNYVQTALADLKGGKAVAKTETKNYGCGVKYGKAKEKVKE